MTATFYHPPSIFANSNQMKLTVVSLHYAWKNGRDESHLKSTTVVLNKKKFNGRKILWGKKLSSLILPCFPVSSSTACVLVEDSILNPSFDLCWLRSWAICFLFPLSAEYRFPFLLLCIVEMKQVFWTQILVVATSPFIFLREVGIFSFFKQANI